MLARIQTEHEISQVLYTWYFDRCWIVSVPYFAHSFKNNVALYYVHLDKL